MPWAKKLSTDFVGEDTGW